MNKRQKKKLVRKYLTKERALGKAYRIFEERHPPVFHGVPLTAYLTVRLSMINDEYQKKMYDKVLFPSVNRCMGKNYRQYMFTNIIVDAHNFKITKPVSPTKREIMRELTYLERLLQLSICLCEEMEVNTNEPKTEEKTC